MRVSYHTFLFLNDVDLPFAIDGNKKVESWLNLFAQSIESIKSWSDDYEVDIFVHSDTELDEFKCKSGYFVDAKYLVQRIRDAGSVVVRLFPDSNIKVMELTPFIYLVDFPVSIATGRIPIELWINNFILSILWCFIMSGIGIIVYNRGIRKYEAYGS